jgi:ADP-heptose:LPS heptosyltransferase
MSGPERILLVKLSSLGDVIQFTPCLSAIRRAAPQAKLTAVVERRFAAVLRHSPHLDRLLEIDSPAGLSPAPFTEPFRALAGLAPFDLAIDFQGLARSAAWVYASRARHKVGIGRLRPGWTAVPHDWQRHSVEEYAAVARAAGFETDALVPEITVSEEDEAAVDERLDRLGLPRTGFLLLNPFSRWHSKTWPLDRQATIVRRLTADFDTPILVTGGPNELSQAEALAARLGAEEAPASLVGELSLGQAFCLYRRAALMLTCDSGPMHAAAALGTPVVALFGPTWPRRSGPWGRDHRVIQARRPPIHRMYKYDPLGRYMRAIEVDAVYDVVADSLQLQASAS